MEEMKINPDSIDELKEFCAVKRWDWPAVFSCNNHGQIWPYVTHGYTQEETRDYVQGELDFLDEIADIYVKKCKWQGGRFFINEDGAFL